MRLTLVCSTVLPILRSLSAHWLRISTVSERNTFHCTVAYFVCPAVRTLHYVAVPLCIARLGSQVCTQRPNILTCFRRFPQTLQTNYRIILHSRPQPLPDDSEVCHPRCAFKLYGELSSVKNTTIMYSCVFDWTCLTISLPHVSLLLQYVLITLL